MVDAPRKETISSRISGMLREQILKGELAPGSKVNLDRLREQHDVSISPLREAVSRLVADGLVEFEDQRGYRVVPVSRENLAEVIMLRSELEVMALRQSIAHGDLEWESNVIRALHRLTHTSRDNDGLDAWEAAHTGFSHGARQRLRHAAAHYLLHHAEQHERPLPPPAAAIGCGGSKRGGGARGDRHGRHRPRRG